MRKIILLTIIIIIFFASLAYQRLPQNFNCEGTGLVIEGDSLTFFADHYSFCRKQGNILFFQKDCNEKPISFIFDEVTHELTEKGHGISTVSYKCRKMDFVSTLEYVIKRK